jgi:hypothetical protein
MRPKNIGIGLAHSQLRGDQKLTERDNIAYQVHSLSESTLSTPSASVVADAVAR